MYKRQTNNNLGNSTVCEIKCSGSAQQDTRSKYIIIGKRQTFCQTTNSDRMNNIKSIGCPKQSFLDKTNKSSISCVHTQIAIVANNKLRNNIRKLKNFTRNQQLSHMKTSGELQYGHAQQARYSKTIKIIKINTKNKAYLLLATFTDPS